jgi:hypothetical protein
VSMTHKEIIGLTMHRLHSITKSIADKMKDTAYVANFG